MTEEPPNYPHSNYPPSNYPPPNNPPATPGGYEYPPLPPNGYGSYGYPPGYPQYSSRSTNGLAIASFVVAIAGFFTCGIGNILALIFGRVAINQIKRTGQGGRGLAIAGIVISTITFVLVMVAVTFGSIARHNHTDTDTDTYGSGHTVLIIPAQQQSMTIGHASFR